MRISSKLLHVLVLLLPCEVHAADMPYQVAPPAAPSSLPLFSWSGFYAGLNAGYVFDGTSQITLTGVTPANRQVGTYDTPLRPTLSDDGFTGGGQIGFNYQFLNLASGGIVAGVETDAAYTDLDKAGNFPTPDGADRIFTPGLDFLGTVRGRLGYAFDQLLVYGTGGFAYGEVNNRVALLDRATNSVIRFGGDSDEVRTGYAFGGGIEYALPTGSFTNVFGASAVTVRAEYLHYDLGSSSVTANPNPATNAIGAYNASVRTSGDLARAGVNYGF